MQASKLSVSVVCYYDTIVHRLKVIMRAWNLSSQMCIAALTNHFAYSDDYTEMKACPNQASATLMVIIKTPLANIKNNLLFHFQCSWNNVIFLFSYAKTSCGKTLLLAFGPFIAIMACVPHAKIVRYFDRCSLLHTWWRIRAWALTWF